MGGYNSATDTLGQAVTVPASGNLRYAWQMTTTEGSITAYDFLRVRVYDASTGAYIATLRTLSNANVRSVWSLDTVSLASWAGQTIRLEFSASTDSTLASHFYIDDVSVGDRPVGRHASGSGA
jgi:thermitase